MSGCARCLEVFGLVFVFIFFSFGVHFILCDAVRKTITVFVKMFDRNKVRPFRIFLEVRPFLRSNIFTKTVFLKVAKCERLRVILSNIFIQCDTELMADDDIL